MMAAELDDRVGGMEHVSHLVVDVTDDGSLLVDKLGLCTVPTHVLVDSSGKVRVHTQTWGHANQGANISSTASLDKARGWKLMADDIFPCVTSSALYGGPLPSGTTTALAAESNLFWVLSTCGSFYI